MEPGQKDSEVMLENTSQGGEPAQPFSEAVFLLLIQSLYKVQTFDPAVVCLTVLLEEVSCRVKCSQKDVYSSVFLNSKSLERAS